MPNSKTNIAAQTYCSFGFQTNYVTIVSKTKIFILNTFTCNLSWVRPDQKDRLDLLEHEQVHFDISEVYRRRLRERFEKKKLNVFNISSNTEILFKDVFALYLER